jgi:hypothetical protein
VNARRFLTAPLLGSALAAVVAMPAVAAPAPLVAGGSFVRTIPFIDETLYARDHARSAAVTTETVATTPLSQWRGCTTASSIAGAG